MPTRSAPVADYGPEVRRKRGDVVLHDRPDPERPNAPDIRGARVRIWYHVLWIEGALSDAEHEAADRYLVRLEQAQGAVEGSPERPQGIRGGGMSGPTERQVMALADLRDADRVLGSDVTMVRAVVGWNIRPPAEDVPDLRDALRRLAEFWGM
jgi:hypothetical protein